MVFFLPKITETLTKRSPKGTHTSTYTRLTEQGQQIPHGISHQKPALTEGTHTSTYTCLIEQGQQFHTAHLTKSQLSLAKKVSSSTKHYTTGNLGQPPKSR
jgi:hypothetical protein